MYSTGKGQIVPRRSYSDIYMYVNTCKLVSSIPYTGINPGQKKWLAVLTELANAGVAL